MLEEFLNQLLGDVDKYYSELSALNIEYTETDIVNFVINKIMTNSYISSKEKAFLVNFVKDLVAKRKGKLSDAISLKNKKLLEEGVAVFQKVSYEEYRESLKGTEYNAEDYYDDIRLPKRATRGSAGYDFYAPFRFELKPGDSIKIPTGIRCGMDWDYVLQIYPRSGLGFKYRCQIDNTVGIIDSDYYNSDNEGHIMIKITNDSKNGKSMTIEKGQGVAQGIFVQYGRVVGDNSTGIRNGGFGSTTK